MKKMNSGNNLWFSNEENIQVYIKYDSEADTNPFEYSCPSGFGDVIERKSFHRSNRWEKFSHVFALRIRKSTQQCAFTQYAFIRKTPFVMALSTKRNGFLYFKTKEKSIAFRSGAGIL